MISPTSVTLLMIVALLDNTHWGVSAEVSCAIEQQAIADIKDLMQRSNDDVRFLFNLSLVHQTITLCAFSPVNIIQFNN